MGEKMTNPPIFFTIGQVRFNPILEMHGNVEALQKEFRKIGFPDFLEDELKAIQVDTSGAIPQVKNESMKRWRFADSRKTAEYLLFKNSVSFQTTAYETSELFTEALLKAVQLLHQTFTLSYIEQVGWRTLDAIVPSNDQGLEDFLRPQLLGFYSALEGELRRNILESVFFITPTVQLIQRVVILKGNLGMPIDLLPMRLTIDQRFAAIDGYHAILDMDCAVQDRFDFDLGRIRQNLRLVKDGVTKAFYDAITEVALKRWR
jgi:uncharacterized protein (TIGR04255 family)